MSEASPEYFETFEEALALYEHCALRTDVSATYPMKTHSDDPRIKYKYKYVVQVTKWDLD